MKDIKKIVPQGVGRSSKIGRPIGLIIGALMIIGFLYLATVAVDAIYLWLPNKEAIVTHAGVPA